MAMCRSLDSRGIWRAALAATVAAGLASTWLKPLNHDVAYPGGELELFGRAANWKAYWAAAYLDNVGLLLSLGNRLLLRRDLPSAAQIAFWDRRIIPLSRILDRLTGHRLGKTVLCVWRRGG